MGTLTLNRFYRRNDAEREDEKFRKQYKKCG